MFGSRRHRGGRLVSSVVRSGAVLRGRRQRADLLGRARGNRSHAQGGRGARERRALRGLELTRRKRNRDGRRGFDRQALGQEEAELQGCRLRGVVVPGGTARRRDHHRAVVPRPGRGLCQRGGGWLPQRLRPESHRRRADARGEEARPARSALPARGSQIVARGLSLEPVRTVDDSVGVLRRRREHPAALADDRPAVQAGGGGPRGAREAQARHMRDEEADGGCRGRVGRGG
mmetsp:Transcript_4734/g.19349  ORF Transcript_4734/g.19349 Transcript_4734/m.19349 type:complete len:232 (-) Transcript_4734:79-774(-)